MGLYGSSLVDIWSLSLSFICCLCSIPFVVHVFILYFLFQYICRVPPIIFTLHHYSLTYCITLSFYPFHFIPLNLLLSPFNTFLYPVLFTLHGAHCSLYPYGILNPMSLQSFILLFSVPYASSLNLSP